MLLRHQLDVFRFIHFNLLSNSYFLAQPGRIELAKIVTYVASHLTSLYDVAKGEIALS